jgi:hypothetical protein
LLSRGYLPVKSGCGSDPAWSHRRADGKKGLGNAGEPLGSTLPISHGEKTVFAEQSES